MSTSLKIIVFSALCLIWSSTWVMIKVGLEGAPPFTAAGLRFMVAALLILVILLLRRIELPRSRAFFRLTLFLGVFQMGIAYGLVYWGEQYISSGLTAVLFSTMPLMVAILARIFLGDPLSVLKVVGILLGTAGVYVIFADSVSLGGRDSIFGIAAVLCSAFLASASSVVAKRYTVGYNPFATMFLPIVYGGVILIVAARLLEKGAPVAWSPLTITSIVYLAVFGSVAAFAMFFWIIKHLDVTIISYQTFIIPILACLLGWIFLGETFTFKVALGGGMILLAIAVAVVPEAHRKRSRGANA